MSLYIKTCSLAPLPLHEKDVPGLTWTQEEVERHLLRGGAGERTNQREIILFISLTTLVHLPNLDRANWPGFWNPTLTKEMGLP